MKVIIAGTRTIRDYDFVSRTIVASGWADQITLVISGCSEQDVEDRVLNADTLGAMWALAHGIPVDFNPVSKEEWRRLGRKGGPLRNGVMAAKGEALILCWNGFSKGSSDMLRRARAAGLEIYAPVQILPGTVLD